ncbi:hypothetical protein ASPCAL12237 [Aspergillus calidoustus]|uniref:Secreted protein n=1 Tax=Aspergillus calidoustus TaxID=454130 RepID=A0A0U5GD18_ASPCI|nr:hypothetical protein ASPCAL12237 [Aspergillus calidoustus]
MRGSLTLFEWQVLAFTLMDLLPLEASAPGTTVRWERCHPASGPTSINSEHASADGLTANRHDPNGAAAVSGISARCQLNLVGMFRMPEDKWSSLHTRDREIESGTSY